METLIAIVLDFPMVLFTVLLALVAGYWLLVALRLAPVELFEHDSLRNDTLASALVSLGFIGVPVSLSLTLLIVLAGLFTLALELAVLRWLPLGFFRIPLGILVIWGPSLWRRRWPPGSAIDCIGAFTGGGGAPEPLPRCLLGEAVRITAVSAEEVTAVLRRRPATR